MDYGRLGQQGFADQVGLSKSVISKVVREKANVGMKVVFQVLDAFPEVNADWLISTVAQKFLSKKPMRNIRSFPKAGLRNTSDICRAAC